MEDVSYYLGLQLLGDFPTVREPFLCRELTVAQNRHTRCTWPDVGRTAWTEQAQGSSI